MESLDELDGITSKLQKTVDELEPADGKRQSKTLTTDLTGSNRNTDDLDFTEKPA